MYSYGEFLSAVHNWSLHKQPDAMWVELVNAQRLYRMQVDKTLGDISEVELLALQVKNEQNNLLDLFKQTSGKDIAVGEKRQSPEELELYFRSIVENIVILQKQEKYNLFSQKIGVFIEDCKAVKPDVSLLPNLRSLIEKHEKLLAANGVDIVKTKHELTISSATGEQNDFFSQQSIRAVKRKRSTLVQLLNTRQVLLGNFLTDLQDRKLYYQRTVISLYHLLQNLRDSLLTFEQVVGTFNVHKDAAAVERGIVAIERDLVKLERL